MKLAKELRGRFHPVHFYVFPIYYYRALHYIQAGYLLGLFPALLIHSMTDYRPNI